jgi:hypothetical protein
MTESSTLGIHNLRANLCRMLLEADKLVEDEEHYFPQEKKLRQPARWHNCLQHFFYDEFINRDLEYSLREICSMQKCNTSPETQE